jgi:hypothetical protein
VEMRQNAPKDSKKHPNLGNVDKFTKISKNLKKSQKISKNLKKAQRVFQLLYIKNYCGTSVA